jgi:acyl-CoA synthetase (NDP forming)
MREMATGPLSSGGPPIDALLEPRSIAIVGASPTSYVGLVLCENLRSLGYEGAVYPINPRYDEILGWRCYPTLADLPGEVDAVVSAVRIGLAPEILRTAGERGARAAVIPGGGFTETGASVLETHREIADVAARFGMAVAGPNCMGVITPGRRASMYIGTIPPSLLPGRVALVSQSGSVIEAAVNMGPRIGFSALISCGTEAVTTVGQYLRFLAADDETEAVTLFIEGFRDPAGFVDGARTLRRAGKPLAVLQAGRSKAAVAAIAAHSGSLAGTDEVVTGLLHQLGAIGVDDLDELFEVAELLGHGRLPKGRRLFVVTDSGGEANLVMDHAEALALELPHPSEGLVRRLQARWPNFSFIGNPIDPWGVDPDYHSLYAEILDAAAQEWVDVVAMALDKVTEWAGENEVELGVAAAVALIQGTKGRDVLPVFLTLHATGSAAPSVRDPLRAAGVPLLHGLRPAMVAIRRAWYWRQWRPRTPVPVEVGPWVELRIREAGPILSERTSRTVLAAYGIPLVPGEAAASADEAVAAAERLGYPVVVKADAAGVAHKAAAGLVELGVASEDGVRRTCAEMQRRMEELGADSAGVLVQATARGVELICGMRLDPAFGPVILVGAGGVLTEILHDVAVRLCPAAPEDLEEMLEECSAGRLLRAVGADPAPVQAVLAALSRLALEHPEIAEVDVNPLFAGPSGVAAADALVVLRSADLLTEQSP